jgi:hypothetical protein
MVLSSDDSTDQIYNIASVDFTKDHDPSFERQASGKCSSSLKNDKIALDCAVAVKFSNRVSNIHWTFQESEKENASKL